MNRGHGHGAPTKTKAEMPFFKLLGKTIPYIWTRNSFFLKITFLMSLIFLVAGSMGDLVVPITFKYAIDDMTGDDPKFPLYSILIYAIASFSSTACDQFRDILFAYVSANTERLVALETFEHLQSLSLNFHLKRETGSVLRSVSRGASSFAGLLRIVLFNIAPVFVQVIVVCIYLFLRYDWPYGVITGGVIILYFVFTFTTTDWRDKYRRVMNDKDNEFNQKATDALLNFETVKYFNAEEHEEKRYDKALQEYSMANVRSQQTLAMLNNGQALIICAGVAGTMILAARQVVHAKDLTVGDWVMLVQFVLTLYQPLGFLGTYYRMIKQSMVDVESMILLWQEKPDIKDAPGAPALQLYHKAPEIQFSNVSFSYSNKVPILKSVSFTVPPGKKVAIVGASGAGKSTLARLIYRFYDVTDGTITIDGQDIRKCSQRSLRKEIAIVPQDCVLFNDTIGYNIGYGAYAVDPRGATQMEIEHAAKSAQLDVFISKQPKQYETKVGERGLRLSGGEKQRVAIARAILKQPAIMIFDEATSSLDTHTEAAIQSAIDAVAAGRTTITVAHRLSTIMNSDVILVLDKGVVVEQGTHSELLARAGLYAKMWTRQQRREELQSNLSAIMAEEQQDNAMQKHKAAPTPSPPAPSVPAGAVAVQINEEKESSKVSTEDAKKRTLTDYEAAVASMSGGQPPAATSPSPSSPSPAKKPAKRSSMKDSALAEPLLGEQEHEHSSHAHEGKHGHGGGRGIN